MAGRGSFPFQSLAFHFRFPIELRREDVDMFQFNPDSLSIYSMLIEVSLYFCSTYVVVLLILYISSMTFSMTIMHAPLIAASLPSSKSSRRVLLEASFGPLSAATASKFTLVLGKIAFV